LAQECDLAGQLQRGPGGASTIDIYQCRQCRRYQQTPKHYIDATPESPQLLALCLKHIPALNSSNNNNHNTAVLSGSTTTTNTSKLHLIDAGFIYTEPHSMRFKVHVTVRTTVQEVPVQQRVAVELHVKWQQCPDCNREFTNRTWMAVVQLRQKTNTSSNDSSFSGLAHLEMTIRQASTPALRKHVLKIDAVKYGFDFYFLTYQHAQTFVHFLQTLHPMRIKTSQKLVSTDVRNATAHMKHTVTCDVVPLLRHDLLLIGKAAKGTALAGRLALVEKVGGSVVKLLDVVVPASSATSSLSFSDHTNNNNNNSRNPSTWTKDLSAETYYRSEKEFHIVLRTPRLTPFVVLDVELLHPSHHSSSPEDEFSGGDGMKNRRNGGSGSSNNNNKHYAWAEVVVARTSDFGVNDTVLHLVTHLGHVLQAGDTVLGYDLETAVMSGGDDSELQDHVPLSYTIPPVVLVKKIKASTNEDVEDSSALTGGGGGTTTHDPTKTAGGKRISKKKLRKQKKEGKKMRELEASAVRMGFLDDEDAFDDGAGDNEENGRSMEDNKNGAARSTATTDAGFDQHLGQDPVLAEELRKLEEQFAALDQ
jgi:nonsense-mediated mRNA decay protein 3